MDSPLKRLELIALHREMEHGEVRESIKPHILGARYGDIQHTLVKHEDSLKIFEGAIPIFYFNPLLECIRVSRDLYEFYKGSPTLFGLLLPQQPHETFHLGQSGVFIYDGRASLCRLKDILKPALDSKAL